LLIATPDSKLGDEPQGVNVDDRSPLARRFRDIVTQISVDQGGLDRMSETRLQLVRRFAGCCVLAENIESKMALGEPIDIAEHSTLKSTAV
jgi:hypothetical protein